MKTIIVGGGWSENPKRSGVIEKLSNQFEDCNTYNGGILYNLQTRYDSDLIIWMPDISNEEVKHYPKKTTGNVLICSKVMREGYKKIDAVERIFRMNANAVIAITKNGMFSFHLIDALGNTWYSGNSIEGLAIKIKELYDFTKAAIRVRTNRDSRKVPMWKNNESIKEFIDLNTKLAERIQLACGERFFGNISTRCQKLFPSIRVAGILVSPRNSDKRYLTPEEMVLCYKKDDLNYYFGDKKPSVDSPIQMEIYGACPQINYMIHGHAFIKDAPFTSDYYLCGDLREAEEVKSIIGKNDHGFLNLKNHGFLLYSKNLEDLRELIDHLEFYYQS